MLPQYCYVAITVVKAICSLLHALFDFATCLKCSSTGASSGGLLVKNVYVQTPELRFIIIMRVRGAPELRGALTMNMAVNFKEKLNIK
jgi:hypothetical protein